MFLSSLVSCFVMKRYHNFTVGTFITPLAIFLAVFFFIFLVPLIIFLLLLKAYFTTFVIIVKVG